MKWIHGLVMSLAVMLGSGETFVMAQRGMGDAAGVVRQKMTPERVVLTGEVLRLETGPCEHTTGRASVGTHLLMASPEGTTWNVHLGPADQVVGLVPELIVGQEVSVEAFATEKMKENHFVAIKISSPDHAFRLREENLQPVWSNRHADLLPKSSSTQTGLMQRWSSPRLQYPKHRGRGHGRGNGQRFRFRGRWRSSYNQVW